MSHRSAANLLLLASLLVPANGLAAPPVDEPPDARTTSTREEPTNFEPPESLEKLGLQVANLRARVDAELRGIKQSFDILVVLGAVGSLIAAFFVLATYIRDRRHHRQYESERAFYEKRVLEEDKRTDALHSVTLQSTKDGAARETKYADRMLTEQIEGISNLSEVIGLVEKTFELQQKREARQEDLLEGLEEKLDVISQFSSFFQGRYQQSSADVLNSLGNLSRMEWTRLSPQERAIAARARADFDSLPTFIAKEQEVAEPRRYARLCQLLGVSAFYDNDLATASRHLGRAREIFSEAEYHPDDRYPRAFCSHFLGLVEKSWFSATEGAQASLQKAKFYLTEAADLLSGEDSEFLTPLTLAEVQSYLEPERTAARTLVLEKIAQLEHLRDSNTGLNANQMALLGRAYLLAGNLELLAGDKVGAAAAYGKALSHRASDHYAQLSLAHVTTDESERGRLYESGLHALEESDALGKQEITTRAVALAWAAAASGALRREKGVERYTDALRALGADIRAGAEREYFFFSPFRKTLVRFDDIVRDVREEVDE